ncbi:MAG TPA: toll/interleukin-1 receptor domain-containing protein [Bacteroidetes bacterium]|nr:toll/interleukin-1 receptor domain-containing protein [Bacteroidota bacterium]
MKIFISYSTQDEKIVRELAKYIPKGVVDIWIDHTKMGGGAKLSKEIKKGINDANIYFLFLSKNSLDSDWVQKEIEWAIKKEETLKYEFIVPILLEEEALKKWNNKKLKDRIYITYLDDFHKMAHEIKDTIITKTIDKYDNECLLKSKLLEYIFGTIVTILAIVAYFTEPTEKEHIMRLQSEVSSCSESQVSYKDALFLNYASCPISQDKELLSVGVFDMIFTREQDR